MYLLISPYYKKDNIIIDTNISFEEDIDFEAFAHKYYIKTGFDLELVDDDCNKTGCIVATVSAIFLRYNSLINDGYDIEDIVDVVDVIDTPYTDDIVKAITTLIDYKLLPSENDSSSLICYLNRVYVYPEFRDKGIANYVFENLKEIFQYISGEKTYCVLIYPEPQNPTEDGEHWCRMSSPNTNLLIKMTSKIKQHGFEEIGKTNFYIKTFY